MSEKNSEKNSDQVEEKNSRNFVAYKAVVKDPNFNYRKNIPEPPPELLAYISGRIKQYRSLPEGDEKSSFSLIEPGQVDKIISNSTIKYNPAQQEALLHLAELASDIHRQGLINPITVRENGASSNNTRTYFLIAGERRYTACGWLGKTQISINIKKGNIQELKLLRFAENLHRQAPEPYEDAEAIKELMTDNGWNQTQVAAKINMSIGWVNQRLSLLNRSTPELKAAIEEGSITKSGAREIVTLPAEKQKELVAELQTTTSRGGKVTAAEIKERVAATKQSLPDKSEAPSQTRRKIEFVAIDDDEDDEDDDDDDDDEDDDDEEEEREVKKPAPKASAKEPQKKAEDTKSALSNTDKLLKVLEQDRFKPRAKDEILAQLKVLVERRERLNKDPEANKERLTHLRHSISTLEWVLNVPNRKILT